MAFTLSSTPTERHFSPTLAPALRALLSRSIDYAGLFPPAELPLDLSLRNYADYLRTDEFWMLNSFVLPIAKFSAAADHFSQFDSARPLRISALAGKSENGDDFREKIAAAVDAIGRFQ